MLNMHTLQNRWTARRRFVATLLIALTASVGVVGCGQGEEHAAALQAPARPPAPVTAVAAVAQDVPIYLDEIGRTQAVEVVSVVPQVSGKVVAAHVSDGAYVNKGDLLFEIDPRPFEAALSSATATLAQRRAELSLAQIEFNRVEEMVATNAISQLEFDQKRSARDVASAQVEAAEAAVQMAKLDLEYTKIRSPIDGRAGARLVDPGNVVRENAGQMLVIQRLDPIYAEFTITENDLGTVRKYIAARGMEWGNNPGDGLRVLVDVPGDSARILSALGAPTPATQPAATQPAGTQPVARAGAGPREGQLSFLDNAVQSGTGTVRLRATLQNEDRYFWPGQFVNVRLVLATKKSAVLIPAQAQQVGQAGPYVYIVKHGEATNPATGEKTLTSIAEMRPIVPGQRHGELVVVEKGVEAGEQVVTIGHMMIQPGGPVSVMQPQSPQGQQTAAH